MFKFGAQSLLELQGVNDFLVSVVHQALEISTVDFSVHDGLRTIEEQKRLFDSGASHTMSSKHLTGQAVDLVPYVNGKLRWEWGPIFEIAKAMRTAAKAQDVNLTWGAAWDINFTESVEPPSMIMEEYIKRRMALGKKPFSDGPHYELRF